MPIGQVFFVPREEITMRDCTDDELADMKKADEEFGRGKAATQITTPYGIPYSPHYLKESRARQTTSAKASEAAPETDGHKAPPR
jgi:hypothetical protein